MVMEPLDDDDLDEEEDEHEVTPHAKRPKVAEESEGEEEEHEAEASAAEEAMALEEAEATEEEEEEEEEEEYCALIPPPDFDAMSRRVTAVKSKCACPRCGRKDDRALVNCRGCRFDFTRPVKTTAVKSKFGCVGCGRRDDRRPLVCKGCGSDREAAFANALVARAIARAETAVDPNGCAACRGKHRSHTCGKQKANSSVPLQRRDVPTNGGGMTKSNVTTGLGTSVEVVAVEVVACEILPSLEL